MPKDNEICLDHFEDLMDDSSPLKSLIDRRIVPSNDKRVKIVGTKRPDVRDFFSNFNEQSQNDQENGNKLNDDKSRQRSINNKDLSSTTPQPTPPQPTPPLPPPPSTYNRVDKEEKTSLVLANYSKINNQNHNLNNNHLTYKNEINGSLKEDSQRVRIATSSTSSLSTSSSSSSSSSINQINGNEPTHSVTNSITVTNDSSSLRESSISLSGVTLSPDVSVNPNPVNPSINSFANKLDKRLSDHDGGFKFIKWTANHRGYKMNLSNKRTTWFSDSNREDEESATIVSLKIKSLDPTISGENYHHFVNQNVSEANNKQQRSTSKQDNNKLSTSLGLGEHFVRARSNSSPEAKESSVLINGHLNDKLNGDETKSGKGYTNENGDTNHSKESNETNQSSNQTSEKKRIGEIIRNLLRRRPTLDEIREKGILIDGPVFGCDLTSLCNREGQFVPKILQYCIEAIEAKGLQTDGLYRICGNLSEVQKIRFQVNHGNYDTIWSQENVHALTGVLKLFLRDLKEPLLPFDLFNSFIFTIGIPDKKGQIEALQKLINQLPKCNYHTLIFLMKHLLRVVQYQEQNRMQIQNLSIIFGPTLMWPRTESNDFSYDMMLRVHCNRIVEILLTEFNAIFMVSMTSV